MKKYCLTLEKVLQCREDSFYHQCVDILSDAVINTSRLRQNGRHFQDDIFKCIFLNEYIWISIKISLQFVPSGPINNIPALVQIGARRQAIIWINVDMFIDLYMSLLGLMS